MEVLKTISQAVGHLFITDRPSDIEPATAMVARPDDSRLVIIPIKDSCVDINNLNGHDPNSFIPQCKSCTFRRGEGAKTSDPGGPAHCTGLKWSELLSVRPRATLYRFAGTNFDWKNFVTYLPCKPDLLDQPLKENQ